MANNITSINLTDAAYKVLEALEESFNSKFSFVSQDYSSEFSDVGASIKVPTPTLSGAALDFTGSVTSNNAEIATSTVTLDTHTGYQWEFSDIERQRASYEDSYLLRMFVKPSVRAIVNKVSDDLFALVTSSNFTAETTVGVASAITAGTFADIAGDLSDAYVDEVDRYVVILPSYHATLLKDSLVAPQYAYGNSDAIQKGMVGNLYGFKMIPKAGIPGNSENLVGFCGHPSGLLMASRPISIPANSNAEIETVQGESGLSVTLRSWYSDDERKWKMSSEILYGVAKGLGGAVHRLVSA